MKKLLLIPILYLLIICSSEASTGLTQVRGQIIHNNHYPAENHVVVLKVWAVDTAGRSFLRQQYAPAFTDARGMYYLYNIRSDNYVLQVYLRDRLRSQISIFIPPTPFPRQFFDIPPIMVH